MDTVPINPDPDTPYTYSLIKGWISDCLTSHGRQQSIYGQGPSRLLCIQKVDGQYDLFLQANFNINEIEYVALSYCWGCDQVYMTTKEKYKTSDGIIVYKNLPKTLQDAIKVTKELGYSFLWVDSLCIIQDCPIDKSREIAKMPSIYNNAILTIAAATAASTAEGFLRDRSTRVPIITNIRFEDKSLHVHDGGLVELEQHKCEALPLDSRAWALQEALLSVHVLEYCPLQLRYICRHNVRESNGVLSVDGWSLASARRTSKDVLHYRLDLDHPSFDLEWRGLVRDYTQRKLSRPTDRILAISGVATAYQDLLVRNSAKYATMQQETLATTHEDYVAGHWLRRLPNDLLWTVYAPQRARPAVYQGPSWSWTSVHGAVGFGSVLWDDDVLGQQSHTSAHSKMSGNEDLDICPDLKPPRPCWEIMSVHASLVDDQAPFGAVTEAILTIRAHCKSFDVISFTNCTMNPSCMDIVLSSPEHKIPNYKYQCIKFSPDILAIDDISPLTLMLFGWSHYGTSEYILRGLALKKVISGSAGNVPRFERCGVFQVRANDGDDADECAEGRWRSLMPFYNNFTEETFEIV